MNQLLFNTHDIVLAVYILFCLFFAIGNNLSQLFAPAVRNTLTVFFALNACAAIDTLVFWGDGVRYAAFSLSPALSVLFSFASFALGPVLYWFVRGSLNPAHKVSLRDYWHLVPACLSLPYLYWACLRHPLEQQHTLILDFAIFSNTQVHFFAFLTLKKLLPVVYGLNCLVLLYRGAGSLSPSLRPVVNLYGGFVLVWVWCLLVHLGGQYWPLAMSDRLGVVGNYLSLALLLVIWFERAKTTLVVEQLTVNPAPDATELSTAVLTAAPPAEPSVQTPEPDAECFILAERIQALMDEQRPHLNSQITLERFAHLLGVSPRQASVVINRCFKQNFQEFINSFRISEAKRRLKDPSLLECTIVEIAQQAGFNSKATFNRLFKLQVGVTPSHFRQECVPSFMLNTPHFGASQDLHNLN
ncbi:MAG: helix-turn-helix transcriptional regulator [Marinagarivorans sp.]